jgi:uncharacterized protein YgbK (DUF1537 family)
MHCQSKEIRYYIVADDLTGACDSAIAFTGRGMVVEVPLGVDAKALSAGVCAISTDSRNIRPEAASERVQKALIGAQAAEEVFKKIDSVLRGNTFAEIRTAVECFSCELVVMSPAYPALGRVVRDGFLHVEDGTSSPAIDLCEGLRRAGIAGVVKLRAGGTEECLINRLRDAMRAVDRLVVCDAEKDEDLRVMVSAARMLKKRILWVGSGGLAHALAHVLPLSVEDRIEEEELSGCMLLFVGSDHVVTAKQLAALEQRSDVSEIAVEDCLRSRPESQVMVLKVSMGSTTEEQIQQAVKSVGAKGIRGCVLTGGDTAAFVFRSLGVRLLRLTGEFAPGVPEGIAHGGDLDGVRVIVKSGGFGQQDVLCRIVDRFAGGRELV